MERPPPRIFSGSRKGRKHSDPQDALGMRCLADGRYWLAVADGVSAHRFSGSVARWVVKEWLSRGMESASLGDYLESVHRDLADEFGDFADILNSCVSISLAEISAPTSHVYWLGD